MTKLRYSFGGAAVRQPCAVCTGAAHECSTEPDEHLPVLGGRHTHNDERNLPGTALAGDKLVADYRLYAEGSGRIAPGGQYRRRVGSCADCGTDAETYTLLPIIPERLPDPAFRRRTIYNAGWTNPLLRCGLFCGQNYFNWHRQAHAHREQVHGLLYVAAHRMTPKWVAV